MVFRPLPGDLISQFMQNLIRTWRNRKFSVPFPGILFLNYLAEGYECESGAVGFRPLSGDLISQYDSETKHSKDAQNCFRPLPGDLISQ